MRKSLALAAAAATSLLLAACAGGPQAASQSGSGDADTIKITTITDDKATPAIIEAYKKTHPDVDFQVDSAPTDAVQTNIRTQLSSGTAPDLFVVWPGDGSPTAVKVVAGAGYLEDLSDQPWVSDVPASMAPLLGIDDKTYLAVNSVAGIPVIYNDNALAEVGVTAPTTWTQVLSMCDAARAKGKVAFALGNQTPWNTQLINYALSATLVYGADPDFPDEMADGTATFADSAWSTTMNQYLDMNKRGCFNDDPLGVSFETATAEVSSGAALGIVMVNAVLPTITGAAPAGTTFSTAPLPATDDASQTVMPLAASAGLALNAKSKHKDAAKEFLAYYMSSEGQEIGAKTSGSLPASPSDGYQPDPALAGVVEFQEADRVTPFMDQRWPNAKVQQVHFAEVQKLFSGSTTVPEALAAMDTAYQQK